MLAKNWLPRPSPLEAPSTKPAISTNSIVVANTLSGLTISAKASRRASGIGTMPEFGSMVQNGKFSAPIPAFVRALKRVDLPTLGRPTIPHLKPIVMSYIKKLLCFKRVKSIHSFAQVAFNGIWENATSFINCFF